MSKFHPVDIISLLNHLSIKFIIQIAFRSIFKSFFKMSEVFFSTNHSLLVIQLTQFQHLFFCLHNSTSKNTLESLLESQLAPVLFPANQVFSIHFQVNPVCT